MLIDFTVENYRSIKEPVTLSTVAQAKTGRGNGDAKRKGITPDDEIAPPFLVPNRKLELLPVLGIFGANASGKSNLVRALDEFLFFVRFGYRQGTQALNWIVPFKLDTETEKFPSTFCLRTAIDDEIFTLTVSADDSQIYLERLEYVPDSAVRARNKLLFERVWSDESKSFLWKNGKDFTESYRAIQESLNPEVPFSSFLIESVMVPVTSGWKMWFQFRLGGLSLGEEKADHDFASSVLHGSASDWKANIGAFLKRFDTGIEGIEIKQNVQKDDSFSVWAVHKRNGSKIAWPLEEESMGTQRLFALAVKIDIHLSSPTLLLIDELGSSIHPNITRAIVRLFQNPETNPKRAQLIFTSHDNTLQRGSLLRRDQIWFTQKRSDGSTDLYPLTDFHPRNDLALDKAYLDGRFGAVPLLPPDEELLVAPAGARGAD